MSSNSSPEMVAQVHPETGEVIGRVDRTKAHLDGTWHASIHVWILDRSNRVLFQQRSDSSRAFPSLWDISAAGHIDQGEDGLREVREELGVTPPAHELTSHGYLMLQHDLPSFFNREHARMYLWKSNLTLADFNFPDDEVQALAGISLPNFSAFIKGATMTAPVLRAGAVEYESISGKNVVPQIHSYWEGVKIMLGTA